MATPSFSRLIVLKYSGPPPKPVEAVATPTPDEEYEICIEEQKARSAQAHEDSVKAREEASKTKSMMGKLGGFTKSALTTMGDAVDKAHASTESMARGQLTSRNQQQFVQEFPALAENSKYVCAYGCKVMHSGQKIEGTAFVCSTAVAFTSKIGIRDTFPLNEIASLSPSVALPTSKAMNGKEDSPPYILPLPHPSVQGNCLQLFTTDSKIIQFLEFNDMLVSASKQVTSSVKGTAYDRLYNFLDHAWRAYVQVPLAIDYLS
eukprot:TRINITY_DN2632_c0_g7_i1.p1 TRINITY_DN2632_c0_g7~~TRINITY_DN2632_c0_g7_i1.p1  ORF type:complete len:262 (+),score=36.52 TRINITY_DN2632_c0_g7_i1:61-846(+)